MTEEHEVAAQRVTDATAVLNAAVREVTRLGLRCDVDVHDMHELGREPYAQITSSVYARLGKPGQWKGGAR